MSNQNINHTAEQLKLQLALGEQDTSNFEVLDQKTYDLGGNMKMTVYICAEGHLIMLRDGFNKFWEFYGVSKDGPLLHNKIYDSARVESDQSGRIETPHPNMTHRFTMSFVKGFLEVKNSLVDSPETIAYEFEARDENTKGSSILISVVKDNSRLTQIDKNQFKIKVTCVHSFTEEDAIVITESHFTNI